MSAQAKPSSASGRHKRRKPLSEKYQTAIAVTATIGLVAGLVIVFGMMPMAPMPEKTTKPSLQETRR